MSTALIRGYYGRRNTGDDALFVVTAWAVRKYGRCDRIYATSRKSPVARAARVHTLFVREKWRGTTRWNRWREVVAARKCDRVIWGGGSNFMLASMLAHARRVLDAAPGATAFATGVSVGPFASSADEAASREVLSRLVFVGVRDRISLERARDLAPQARVELTFDLATLLPRASGIDRLEKSPKREGLGIALCKHESYVGEDTQREAARPAIVADAVRRCAAAGLLRKVTVIDFNGHHVFGTHDVNSELVERIKDCVEVRRLPYNPDPLAVMRTISGLDAIVAMKLHSAVFAYCTQTPALILSYHEKCREWGSMIGAPDDLIVDTAEFTSDDLVRGIERVMDPRHVLSSLPVADAEQRALKNWTWLDPA